MNKKFRLLVLMILMFLLVACGAKNEGNGGNVKDKLRYLEVNQISEKLENDDSFILVAGDDMCPACADYKKTLNKFIEDYEVDIYYLEIKGKAMSSEEKTEILDFRSDKLLDDRLASPTTYRINEGKVIDNELGAIKEGDLYNFFVGRGRPMQ